MDWADLERKVREIEERAEAFRANLQMGQCPACGAFRLDGRPPLIHERDCPYRADAPLLYLADGTPI